MKLLLFATASGAIATSTALDSRGLRRYSKLKEEVASLRSRDAELAQDNLRLAREVDALQHDPRYQERAVREELGLIRPGDLVLELDEAPVSVALSRLVAGGPR
jgi:cell division protein FtsB